MVTINGVSLPTTWKEISWPDYYSGQIAADMERLAGYNEAVDEALSFLKEKPEPAVLDKPIDLHPLEHYITARQAIKQDPTNWLEIVRCFWPDIAIDCDTVISHYLAIKEGFERLDKDFELLNKPASALWVRAGIGKLSAFGDMAMVFELAGDDLTKDDVILQMSIRHVFTRRLYKVVKADIELEYAKLLRKKRS